MRFELVLKSTTGVLAAAVRMMHQARRRTLPETGHRQRVSHDIRRHARLQRPTYDFPVEQVEHDRQIQPALVRPQVGDVRCPDLIRCRRREVSGQQSRFPATGNPCFESVVTL